MAAPAATDAKNETAMMRASFLFAYRKSEKYPTFSLGALSCRSMIVFSWSVKPAAELPSPSSDAFSPRMVGFSSKGTGAGAGTVPGKGTGAFSTSPVRDAMLKLSTAVSGSGHVVRGTERLQAAMTASAVGATPNRSYA